MSSSQHVHVTTRHSPPHVRKTARSAPSSKSAGTSKATIKGAKATKRDKGEDEEIFEDDNEDMGSSFLQFWFVAKSSTDLVKPSPPVTVPCAKNKSLFPTPSSSTVQRGTDCPSLPLTFQSPANNALQLPSPRLHHATHPPLPHPRPQQSQQNDALHPLLRHQRALRIPHPYLRPPRATYTALLLRQQDTPHDPRWQIGS